MRELADDSPWKRAEVRDLLEELATKTELSSTDIAKELNTAFGLNLTRNAIIGRVARQKLDRPRRESGSPRNGGKRKANGHVPASKPRPKNGHRSPFPKPFVKKVTGAEETPMPSIAPAVINWPEPVEGRKLTLMELNDTTCRWPLGEWTDSPPYLYCGNIVARGCYCRRHAELSYERPQRYFGGRVR